MKKIVLVMSLLGVVLFAEVVEVSRTGMEIEIVNESNLASNDELFIEAEKAYKSNKTDEAKIKFTKLLEKKYAKRAIVNFYLGEIEYKSKNFREALRHFQESISTDDKSSFLQLMMFHSALSLEKLGDKSSAKKILESMIKTYPNNYLIPSAKKKLSEYDEYPSTETAILEFKNIVQDKKSLKFDSFSALYDDVLKKLMENLPKLPIQTELAKGEFEKQAEFEKRIETTKKANATAIEIYKREYQANYAKAKKEAMQKSLEMYYGKPIVTGLAYDAENEIFGAKLTFENNSELKHNIVIKMPPSQAQQFRADFAKITPTALFDFDGSNVSFKTVRFDHNKKSYLAMLTDKAIGGSAVQVAKLDANQPNMTNIATNISINQGNSQTFDASSLVSTNDLDDLLSKAHQAKSDPKKWLFVVGLENYKYTDSIVYAKRSAEMFAKVAQKTMGVPKQNSYELINEGATAAEIKNKMKIMLRNVKAGDTIYFYYNGHGVPAVNKQNEAFMLSADMMPDFVGDEPAFMMKQIYKELSDSKASHIVAVVDSCFSGSTDGKSIHKGVAAGVLKPKAIDFDKTKMVVLTAGRDTQYSNAYNQKAHRMFSYFVMEELLKGEKNIKELYGKVYKNTKETTRANYGDMRLQEPTMEGNAGTGF